MDLGDRIPDFEIPELPKDSFPDDEGEEDTTSKPEGWEREYFGATKGSRNDSLSKLAGQMIAKNLSKAMVHEAMIGINNGFNPPLGQREVAIILDSIWKIHRQKHPEEKPNKSDFGQPYGASDIINNPVEQDEIYIEPLMVAGDQGFLVAPYKIGKSNFMLQETISLACGIPFLGMPVPKARRVFYLRFELKESRFRERFKKMFGATGDHGLIKVEPFFKLVRGFDLRRDADFKWLVDTLDELGIEVLLIDPMYKLSPSTKLREDEGGIYTRRFDELKTHFPKLHVQVAHHPRKTAGGMPDNSWDASYGSMFLFANMDYEVKIQKKGREKGVFEFSHISNDLPIDDFTFKRNPDNLLYELETREDAQTKYERAYFQIAQQVNAGTKSKTNLITWITTNLTYTRKEARECIDHLLNSGQLEWIGKDPKHGKLHAPKHKIERGPADEKGLFDEKQGY